MNIQLFNFLEDYNAQIVHLVCKRIAEDRPALKELSEDSLKSLVEQYLDGYIDLLVTGDTSSVDRVFRLMSRVLTAKGSQLSNLFDIPLVTDSVIRKLLANEFIDLAKDDAVQKFNESLDDTEETSHKCAIRLLDVFQEQLEHRTQKYNKYLERVQHEFNVDLKTFSWNPEESERVEES